MAEKLNQDQIEELLTLFHGELKQQEIEQLCNQCIKEEDKKAYVDFLQDYLKLRWAQEEQAIHTTKARKRIFSSLHHSQSHRWIYYATAAVIAILLVVGISIWHRQEFNSSTQQAHQTITPIQPQATLILSTGEKIQLNQDSKILQEKNGTIVKIDSAQGIQYPQTPSVSTEELLTNKIVIPKGGEFHLTLSDGTQIWLNADSELEYPVHFTAKNREVKLKGEAYFKVTKDAHKPFIVKAMDYTLQVYGTEFNLNAYHLDHIQVVLINGEVGSKANSISEEQRLKPSQLAVINMNTGKTEVQNVDVYPYIAWQNRDIVFVNERLESIMEKVTRWYDVDVFFQEEALKDLRFDGNIQRYANIEELFFFLEKTSEVQFNISKRTVIVKKKK